MTTIYRFFIRTQGKFIPHIRPHTPIIPHIRQLSQSMKYALPKSPYERPFSDDVGARPKPIPDRSSIEDGSVLKKMLWDRIHSNEENLNNFS
ncbi:hypothetical protein B9Z19DRAFT_1108096, partial [Tuber borchii]